MNGGAYTIAATAQAMPKRASSLRLGLVAGVLGAFVAASPAAAHETTHPLAASEPIGPVLVSAWLIEDDTAESASLVLYQEADGRPVSDPAPRLIAAGAGPSEPLTVVPGDPGWFSVAVPLEATEVVVSVVDDGGRTTAAALPLTSTAPWWTHAVIVVGLIALVALADRLVRQFVRFARSAFQGGVRIHGNV